MNLYVSGTDPTTGAAAVMNVGSQLYLNIAAGNTASVTNGGLLEFASAAPAMGFFTNGSVVTINGGGLSYKGVTGVDMGANQTPTANTVGAFTWQGNNAFRLNGSTETGAGAYTFANNLGAANYTALQLYGASSIARAITLDGANGGKLLLKGATATVTGGITLTGTVPITATGSASTLTGVITGGGSLVKAGPGTLTLASNNNYSGNTFVNEGTLSIKNLGSGLADASKVEIDTLARMDLNFAGSDQIAELWLGDVQMNPGTYNSLTPTYGSYFTGAGSLAVVPLILPGDANDDGVVDAADYIAVKRNFGTTSGATVAQGNFNGGAGTVDWADLQILMGNVGTGGASPAATPEPATLALLALGGLAIIRRR